jgi:ribosomal protein L11 methyltransferase
MLDFGSGSGILSIAGAKLGATVDAVEHDPAAIAHSRVNAEANDMSRPISYFRSLDETSGPFDLVVANILRDVVIAHAPTLVSLGAPTCSFILSGLTSTDVPAVCHAYEGLLGRPEIYDRAEWRALVWRPRARGIVR